MTTITYDEKKMIDHMSIYERRLLERPNRMKVYLMCGVIGSGKSTWARAKAKDEPDTLIVSRDCIRSMNVFDKNLERYVRNLTDQAVCIGLDDRFDVIIDETNLTKKTRRSWIELCTEDGDVEMFCAYCSSKEGNVDRRMNDSRGIEKEAWENICSDMLSSFEEPTLDEGFKEIIEIKIENL